MTAHSAAAGVHVHANPSARQAEILTDEALAFVADLTGASTAGGSNSWRGAWSGRSCSTPGSCRIS